MTARIDLRISVALILTVAVVSCADTTSGPGATPSELQTLDEFMGWGTAAQEAEYEAYVDLRNTIEEMLVVCMAEHGLEYVPREADPGSRPVLGEGMSESEFMSTYGYGISSAMLDEARWNLEYPPDEVGEDPDTLWGEFTDDVESYMVLHDECEAWAEEELGRPDPSGIEALAASVDEARVSLEGDYEEMQERMARDERLTEAEEAWTECMGDRGYDFGTVEDIERYLLDELGAVQENVGDGTMVLTRELETDLQPLVDEELAIAAADLDCRAELDPIRLDLQREYEGVFIDEHREELEELRELERQLMELRGGWQW
jgi:hypothetical protein